MNTKVVAETNSMDTVKLVVALAMLLAGVVAFQYYADAPRLMRIGGMILDVVLAVALAAQTDKGRMVIGFVRDAQIEVRKVVWPTRQETVQTTVVVMIVVVVFAFLLWVLDIFLGWAMQSVIGHGA
ncbi:MAG: preprotein translocase subunit SecE [Proteobacteria bacterium]|nr:preprotein translocase subunit SecE [Pseudomonadota bacterium]MBK8959069.1 preprotein translocase subunit SecE [Pseudomonadota bacterium]